MTVKLTEFKQLQKDYLNLQTENRDLRNKLFKWTRKVEVINQK